MRPILLNTYDRIGGAARAAYRLHRGLLSIGVDSRLVVQRKVSDDATVHGPTGPLGKAIARARPRLDSMPLWKYRARTGGPFSPGMLPDGLARRIAGLGGDLLHLHWVADGFLHVSTPARVASRVVWTLHDSWAFTGGCHVPGTCIRYREACGACPVLGSSREDDLSNRVLERKRRAWKGWMPALVTPSRWLADSVRSSALFREASIEVIPNGLDLARFKPFDRGAARDSLGLPPDRFLLLFGGVGSLSDPNKGFAILLDALARLRSESLTRGVELVVVGSSQPRPAPTLSVPARFVGSVADEESMALYHAAADALVLPSLQENHPNMAIEAMACGTPTVAFRASGLPDVVEHLATGYLADPYASEDLARGIEWVLGDEARGRLLREATRSRAERDHDIEAVARRYRATYARLLDSP